MSDATNTSSEGGQQHPLALYFKVWIALFVLSTLSYMVDFYQLQGTLRWFLIITFMWVKAILIMSVFMHMRWERTSLVTAITVPPLCIGVLVFLMAIEARYTNLVRSVVFGG